ncbi:MAG: hypothetical protein HBSAPP02_28040 [Phycisphaerae bacterium]|nr:MAG: hypothetical protein HRU71_01070 [Planctomycetia bacterium]GJQ27772.1 MAG: hypothetical protein HBSAPP02_28040 [Phycisphaerae bacterium]
MLCALTIRSTVAEDPPPGGNTEPPYGQPLCGAVPVEGTPVFTGAMGWAKYAFHNPPQNYNPNTWYEVTHPGDYLPGVETPIQHTLRYAIEQLTGPRNIKVLVNGTIKLKSRLSMDDQSYVKITGEYATGIGPTVTGDEFRIKDCNNIVLRYLRFRSAEDPTSYHCARSLLILGEDEGCNDIIVDHCSIGASRDDNISVYGKLCRVTVQNCIIGGGVMSISKAGIGSGGLASNEHERLTYCRNLITNTKERQLHFSGHGRVDFFNNVVSINKWAIELASDNGTDSPKINIINNQFETANAWTRGTYFEDPIRARIINAPTNPPTSYSAHLPKSTNEHSIFVSGNRYRRYNPVESQYEEPYLLEDFPQWAMTYDFNNNAGHSNPLPGETDFPTVLAKSTAFDMPSDTILDTEDVKDHVLANAGCRLPVSGQVLDEHDKDLVDAAEVGDRLYKEDEGDNNGFPGTPILVSPADEATGVSTTVTLSWAASDETNCYLIAFGTLNPPSINHACQVSDPCCATPTQCCTPDTEFELSGLQPNTTYYWQVYAKNPCSIVPSANVRSFTTGS